MTCYLFKVELYGYADSLDEAWQKAVEGFAADPGVPEEGDWEIVDDGGEFRE